MMVRNCNCRCLRFSDQDEQDYLAYLNTQTNGFITKSNLYIIKPLVNKEEILKHLGDLKNKH